MRSNALPRGKGMTGSEIRQRFLKYFERHGHTIVPSSSLVPAQDPTLLFTNAGMVQFKAVFLGEERRKYVRATTCQKCVRAGGKHNDLENVGRTARHHTFFEMLGNFSFGDYFKADAVAFAWEFLTKDLSLPRDRLAATVFTDDDEAFELWKKVAGLGSDRILRLGEKDNFWAMGETGPCGPCSEIHFHQGDHLPCAETKAGRTCLGPACECDRWLEVWNLVFMQFSRDASGALSPLPKPSIDTGMGLERVAAILQGVQSNFETDLLRPLVTEVEDLSGRAYGERETDDISMRVIADHARASTFLIADGVVPSNEWRGYVLRRIMRRALRHGRLLGLGEPFLWRLSSTVVDLMGEIYLELKDRHQTVAQLIRQEEERFAETLDRGLEKIREYMESRSGEEKIVDGRFLFTLYDTHGFPVDLAEEIFGEQGYTIPESSRQAFEAEMATQRERARAAASFGGEEGPRIFQDLAGAIPSVEFLGYDALAAPAKILALVREGTRLREVAAETEVEVILDRTVCYAESGGQVGDRGLLQGREGRGEILDTVLRGPGLIVHRVRVTTGGFHEGEEVAVAVEAPRRQAVRLNHTGTHLLHAALRKVLGTHVTQAGSLVASDRLRFDFTHQTQVKDRELGWVEDLVNEKVRDDLEVDRFYSDLDEALRMGALALFGEKYGQRVRVVKIADFSVELCGGTHLDRTGQVGLFKVTDEGAVAAGVRRIEAVTGAAALQEIGRAESALRESAALLKIPPLELPQRLAKLLEDQRHLERRLDILEAQQARGRAPGLVAKAAKVGDITVVAARLDGLNAEELRTVVDSVKERIHSTGVIFLDSFVNNTTCAVSSATPDLIPRFHAGKLMQEVTKAVGGKGGGRPDMAQGGGIPPEKLDEAVEVFKRLVEEAKSA